jgi:catechol 2,3-dioxygenase-like lactoylglutathione lyase family enzyme
MIEGLSHITLIVSDLDRTESMLETIFDAKKVYDSGEGTFSLSKERFFLIGDVWVATMLGDPLPSRTYNHVAFKVSDEEFETHLARVRGLGLDFRPGRPRVEGEAQSIYFYDHDNHLFELHTGTLAQRLERYRRG